MYIPASEHAADAVRLVARQYYGNDYQQRRRYIHPAGIFGIVAAGFVALVVLACCISRRRRNRRQAMVAGGTAPAHKWGGGWNTNNNAHKPYAGQQNGAAGYYNPGGAAAPPPYAPPQQGGPAPMAPAYTATHHGQGENANYYSSTTHAPEVSGLNNQNNGRW